jgi:hypothetical protein
MEVDEKPKEDYSDIGGLDKQIQASVGAGAAAGVSLQRRCRWTGAFIDQWVFAPIIH